LKHIPLPKESPAGKHSNRLALFLIPLISNRQRKNKSIIEFASYTGLRKGIIQKALANLPDEERVSIEML
jgi:hypothetical protein